METKPAIIVIAYNRDACLQRLLSSLARANYPTNNIPLVISVDKSDNNSVKEVAEKFTWPHGTKELILHEQRLGLKKHVLSCGVLSEKYGTVILLEDDLLVSPSFYMFCTKALTAYGSDRRLAGVSLYSYQVTENEFRPFNPIDDGSDAYFMQLPSSWGQLFTAEQWRGFEQWYITAYKIEDESVLPEYVKRWSASSWKKHFVHYMMQSQKYFVFPRASHTTNFSEEGENSIHKGLFQVPLTEQERHLNLQQLSNSSAVYDSSFEPLVQVVNSKTPLLQQYDYEVDLLGTKSLNGIQKPFLLSSKMCSSPLFSFGNQMAVPLQNVTNNLPGNFFHFGKTKDFTEQTPDFASYYVSARSIKEKFLNQEISDLSNKNAHNLFDGWSKDFLAYHKLNTEYPFIHVLLLAADNEVETEETIQSVHKQQYPDTQYHITVFTPQDNQALNGGKNTSILASTSAEMLFRNFREVMLNSKGQYFVIAKGGDVFFEKSFKEVNHIFRKYPDINWLTGIQTRRSHTGFNVISGSTPARRWNRHIFERNLYKNAGRSLSPASTFWKKYLWDIAAPHVSLVSINSLFDDLWLAFFKVQELYTCDVYLSSTRNFNVERIPEAQHTNTLVEDGLFNKLQEFLFVNNVPYLRAYYKSKNCLPPVVRYDHKSKSYFLSDY